MNLDNLLFILVTYFRNYFFEMLGKRLFSYINSFENYLLYGMLIAIIITDTMYSIELCQYSGANI